MSEEIVARKDDSLIEYVAQKSLPAKLKESITSALAAVTEEKALRVISESLESNALRKKALQVIKKETSYIARIPKKLEGDMKAGLLDFMTDSKTGDNLGILVNSKSRAKGIMRIEKANVPVDISANITSIAVQQQLAEMAEVINDVRSRVIALQEGHDLDLFGSIRGMHQQMIQMRDAKDADTQKQLAYHAITVLNETRGKIEVAVISTLKDMPIIPNSDGKIIWQITKDKNFLSDVTEKYDRVEELISYYLTATQLLGYAYAFLGEENAYEDIFSPCPELLDDALLQKLISAESIYAEDITDAWYKCPAQYMLPIKDAAHQLFVPKDDDVIELEISGDKLLEELTNG